MKKHGNARRIPLLILALILCLAGCAIPMKPTDDASGTADPGSAAPTTAAPVQTLPAAKQLEERWLSGDLSDLAGTYRPAPTDPEEAAKLQAIQDDFAAFIEETAAPEQKPGLLDLLRPYTKLTLPEIPADAVFPLEVKGSLETPDVAAILTGLHYETYTDSEKLMQDLAAALEKGGFPTRTAELALTLEKDGNGVYAAPDREALLAFYGGFAELYRQAYLQFLTELGEMIGGQE